MSVWNVFNLGQIVITKFTKWSFQDFWFSVKNSWDNQNDETFNYVKFKALN